MNHSKSSSNAAALAYQYSGNLLISGTAEPRKATTRNGKTTQMLTSKHRDISQTINFLGDTRNKPAAHHYRSSRNISTASQHAYDSSS